MESPAGTMDIPISVQEQLACDLEGVIFRVREMVQGNTGQREWALARTNLEQAAHWITEARGYDVSRPSFPTLRQAGVLPWSEMGD